MMFFCTCAVRSAASSNRHWESRSPLLKPVAPRSLCIACNFSPTSITSQCYVLNLRAPGLLKRNCSLCQNRLSVFRNQVSRVRHMTQGYYVSN